MSSKKRFTNQRVAYRPILGAAYSEFVLAMWHLQFLSVIGRWGKCSVVLHLTSWFINSALKSRLGLF